MGKLKRALLTVPLLLVVGACTTPTGPVGSLHVDVHGLPDDTDAAVAVAGPGGFVRHLTESGTLTGLAPGEYEVSAGEVTADDVAYVPAPAVHVVEVEAGETSVATVTYTVAISNLEVRVVGLPVGVPADITVTGPGAVPVELTDTTTLTELEPGIYEVAAGLVAATLYTFEADVTHQEVVVHPGATTQVTVVYVGVTGAVAIDVTGLPSGASPAVSLVLQGGPVADPIVFEGELIADLTPGTYTILVGGVTFDHFGFEPDTQEASIVVAGGSTTSVHIAYAAVDGKLQVVTEGAPGGDQIRLGVLHGPSFPTGQAIFTTETWVGLAPGAYDWSEKLFESVIGGVTYFVDMPDAVTVSAGALNVLTATFHPQQGHLRVEITGLPPQIDADVRVFGAHGWFELLTQTTTLFALQPGSYLVSPFAVPDPAGGLDFEPCPHDIQSVTVAKGESTVVRIHYAKPPVIAPQSHCIFTPFSYSVPAGGQEGGEP